MQDPSGWSIDIDVVEQHGSDTIVNAQAVLVGDEEHRQRPLYRDEVAWQTLKSDLIRQKMGFQLSPPDWSDPDMKGADRALAGR
jgi:hypothetical protein